MMAELFAGIDSHQHTLTIAVIDSHGTEVMVESVPNSAAGYAMVVDVLTTQRVSRVGVEGSGSWGSHVALAVCAAGFDAREVPPGKTAAQRRTVRAGKTDRVDAAAIARVVLAEPDLGPVQVLDAYDPIVAEIEAVLSHRRMLVETRSLELHHVAAQLEHLPAVIRDQLDRSGDTAKCLRRLGQIDVDTAVLLPAGRYRWEWLCEFAARDREALAEIRRLERELDRLLDEHGTTLRDEPGIATIGAATLVCEVGDPFRFASDSKFARWCGTGAVPISSGEGTGQPVRHRVDFGGNRRVNSVIYIASTTQQRCLPEAAEFIARKRAEGKTARMARRAHKRHLARRIITRMWADEHHRQQQIPIAA